MKLENVKIADLTFGHVLRLIRELAFVVVLSYLGIKVFSGELSLDFTKLSASELVSMLLAFFSIALSAAFYFAATNSSNQFYDNISKFNKDTSELLGRVDEKVNSVNNRQDELRDSFNKHYSQQPSDKLVEKKAATEQKIKDAENAWNDLLKGILNSAQVDPSEKDRLENELRSRDAELSELREQSSRLKLRSRRPITRHTKQQIKKIGLEEAVSLSPKELLFRLADDGVSAYRRDLEMLGYITSQRISSIDEVTEDGVQFITDLLERILDSETETS